LRTAKEVRDPKLLLLLDLEVLAHGARVSPLGSAGMNDNLNEPLTGGCMCGTVRWELSEPPIGSGICHCKRCQRRTGSATSYSALALKANLRVVSGEDSLGSYAPEEGWHKYFCRECGSAVYTLNPEADDVVGMRMGGFDDDPGVSPAFHQYTAYAPAWAPVPDDGLLRFEERVDLAKVAEVLNAAE
jgi:hypothetical protein